ncbi:MAG: tRNA 2-thiouridine(34) synthase MnmA [Candidatus Berkelbacteria bacterium]|nr:MAG: tRNA 2-thiouridine(34) synthase MnmA [Candidatus Berkelbacteria bacterium]QQG51565.1 MAG: tRNA 2-thiouridine(34) synthase MnmA [Candidatus Berkelbacteria bacterium]
MKAKAQRVVVLMSGGVDSSVAAALLKEQGFDVVGVYILGWTGTPEYPCTWQEEEADAKAVAKQLDINFLTINLTKEYEHEVIERFFAGYQQGVTPNPDVLCNREIKFKALWRAVRQLEPDYLATGHYAKKVSAELIGIPKDKAKDQTYFLWGIERSILPSLLFPLGDKTKAEVRELAKSLKLPTAAKKDSQGICFIGPLKVREFLKSRIKASPGVAVLADGRVIGEHQGVRLYTIGQRLGSGSVKWTGDVPPLFVVAKDKVSNRLVVGPDQRTYSDELVAAGLNLLVPSDLPKRCQARVRYRQEAVEVTVSAEKGEQLRVKFKEPVRALTPGQSIVFYDKDKLLGGAIVEAVPANDLLVEQLYGEDDRPAASGTL